MPTPDREPAAIGTPNFRFAVARILEHEGGLVDHPDDPGGVTNRGVSLRWLRTLGPVHGDFDDDGDVDADDVRALGEVDARRLYYDHFWRRHYDNLHREVAYRVADHHVNAGPRAAGRVAQRAARAHGHDLAEDGIIGPRTVGALREVGAEVVPALREARAGWYRALSAQNPRFRVFLRGWLRRAYA